MNDNQRDRERGQAAGRGASIAGEDSAFAFGADGNSISQAGAGTVPSARGTGQGRDDRKSNTAFATLNGAAAGIGPIPGSSTSASGGSKDAYRPGPGDPGGMGGVRGSGGGDPSSPPRKGEPDGGSRDQ